MTHHTFCKTRPHTSRVCLAMICGAILSMAPGCADDSNPPAATTNNVTSDCTPTAGGIEICDGLDNDCDDQVDEDYEVGASCIVEGCEEAGTQVCADDQTSTECERPLSCVGDMGEVDMPEDEGQPDQSEPCDNACSGQTPVCDVANDTCVECLTSNECGSDVCDTATKSCVECLGDQDCTVGVCLVGATTEDNACVADADCSHLTNLGQCVAGTCRECTTETEDADCGGNVCDPTTFTCTNLTIGDAGQLETCVSDTQCATGNACIPLNYMGAPHGNYCMPMYTQGECPNPYGAGPQNRTSVNGSQGLVCMIREARTTPEAIDDYFEPCSSATEATDCPEVGSICRVFNENAIPPTYRCTYLCDGESDCKGSAVCGGPVVEEYCRPQ